MDYKFKSLKLYATIVFTILFTVLLFFSKLDAGNYTVLMGTLMGYYFASNVASKFAKKKDIYLSSLKK